MLYSFRVSYRIEIIEPLWEGGTRRAQAKICVQNILWVRLFHDSLKLQHAARCSGVL